MRSFLLSLPVILQLLIIVLTTMIVAFSSAVLVHFFFSALVQKSELDLVASIYEVLGTIYAVLIAFSVSGVWQNYCESELSVTAEVAALMDLIHTVDASNTDKSPAIRKLVMDYLSEVIQVEWPLLAMGRNQAIMSLQSQSFSLSMQILHEVQTIQPVNARDNTIFSHVLALSIKWLDLRRTRIMISKGNIAKSLWPVLIAGAFILFAFHGLFIFGNDLLWNVLLFFFSAVVGLAFYLIFTLDSPFAGYPFVDSSPLDRALSYLKGQAD